MIKTILLLITGCLVLAPIAESIAETPSGPQAFVSESTYEFESVIEGRQVTHQFILHNQGDEPLEIIKIESG